MCDALFVIYQVPTKVYVLGFISELDGLLSLACWSVPRHLPSGLYYYGCVVGFNV